MADYASIRADILKTLERESDAVAATLVDTWIALAEADFATTLKAPWAERMSSFDYDGATGFAYLPPSFVGMINVLDLTTGITLTPITPQEVSGFALSTGEPTHYVVVGYQLIILPKPSDTRRMMLFYHSKQEPLSAAEPINDVTANSPGIYYYGALRHAAVYYGETENLNVWNAAFDQLLTNANGNSVEWRRGAGAPEWRGP